MAAAQQQRIAVTALTRNARLRPMDTLLLRKLLRLICAISLAACGGTIVSTAADGGTQSDSGGADATSSDSATADCASLKAAYEYQLQQATVCCPVCNNVQCGNAQPGLCCPISTTATSIPSYTAALNAYLAASCAVACPATPCPVEPSGNCESPDPGNPSAMGYCQ
jgi:hypothetical protein